MSFQRAGVHVRSAATLGGHFGLCATHPLPTDLGLVLAAAGARLQVMTVHHHTNNQQNLQLHNHSNCHYIQQQQQQGIWYTGQQQQQAGFQQQQPDSLDLQWMSVEAFLAGSAVGLSSSSCLKQGPCNRAAAAAADSHVDPDAQAAVSPPGTGNAVGPDGFEGISSWELDPESIAGARSTLIERQVLHQAQEQQAGACSGSSTGSCSSDSAVQVVTAVWLPYADDTQERFWSYKLSWRHSNSHAFVNMAVWLRLQSAAREDGSKPAGDAGGSLEAILPQVDEDAGRVVTEARVLLGCPPTYQQQDSTGCPRHQGSVCLSPGRVGVIPGSTGSSTDAGADKESWVVLRTDMVEKVLTGTQVTPQVRSNSQQHGRCILISNNPSWYEMHHMA